MARPPRLPQGRPSSFDDLAARTPAAPETPFRKPVVDVDGNVPAPGQPTPGGTSHAGLNGRPGTGGKG
jgi:hypothetical protein